MGHTRCQRCSLEPVRHLTEVDNAAKRFRSTRGYSQAAQHRVPYPGGVSDLAKKTEGTFFGKEPAVMKGTNIIPSSYVADILLMRATKCMITGRGYW